MIRIKNCLLCGDEFTGVSGYCSERCEDEWEDRSLALKKEKFKTEKEKEGLEKIQYLEKKKMNLDEKNTNQIPTLGKGYPSTTKSIEIQKNTSPENQLSKLETSTQDKSINLSESLKQEVLNSMNMLNKLDQHTFSLIENISNNLSDVRHVQSDQARVVAECGKQIINSMRMKLDILKFIKEIRKELHE